MQWLKLRLCGDSELFDRAAAWFSEKWRIPVSTYRESFAACSAQGAVPQWYLVLEGVRIVAGAGVIDNDFHLRRDLSPNLCALYVEPEFRGRGIARGMLNFVRDDLCSLGIERVYLVTDRRDFYENCGWQFLTMTEEESGRSSRLYAADTRRGGAEPEEWARLYRAAKELRYPREISPRIESGSVSAALLTEAGNLYTGVCIDTACSLGMCAERNAVASMLTHGESRVKKLLALLSDGEVGMPCGACRELLMQLPDGGETEILCDFKSRRTVRLRELLPEWWGK